MQDPFDVIRKYFRPAAAAPDAGAIATPETLSALLPLLVTALGALKIVPLNEGERQAFRGKDPVNQRQVSRGLLRLLRRRPHLAQRAHIDAATYEVVTQKDEALDLLSAALGHVLQLLDDGLLVVRAGMSRSTTVVVSYVRGVLRDGDADPALTRRVRTLFAGVDLSARDLQQKQVNKARRGERKLRAGEAALAQARQELADQPAIDRLREDAKQGRPAPGRGPGKRGAR